MNVTKPEDINKKFIYACIGLGKNKPDIGLDKIIDECIDSVLKVAQPRVIFREFDIKHDSSSDRTYIDNSQYELKGEAIKHNLSGCNICVLMAVTLGLEVDKLLRLTQIKDMSKAIVMDACASSLAEDICDRINMELKVDFYNKGYNLKFRFSPGYGDFPLEAQDIFSGLLNMEKEIGLTQTKDHLLIPRKSVTAIIGLLPIKDCANSKDTRRVCEICSMKENCSFKKSGGYCGRIDE